MAIIFNEDKLQVKIPKGILTAQISEEKDGFEIFLNEDIVTRVQEDSDGKLRTYAYKDCNENPEERIITEYQGEAVFDSLSFKCVKEIPLDKSMCSCDNECIMLKVYCEAAEAIIGFPKSIEDARNKILPINLYQTLLDGFGESKEEFAIIMAVLNNNKYYNFYDETYEYHKELEW